MKIIISLLVIIPTICNQVSAETLKRVYLAKKENVHVVTLAGKDLQMTTKGHRSNVKLSTDGETAAWLIKHTWIAEGATEPGASELVIYRKGKTRTITCEPFIREYWFWHKGNNIVIDCGGLHFAGREILYDLHNNMKELDNFDQTVIPVDKRPLWSISSDHFCSE